jgi:diguanylate cyclase (GGDEF)-like protein
MSQSYLDALLLGRAGESESVRGARIGAVLFVGAATIVWITLPLTPPNVPRLTIGTVSLVALAVGLVIPRLPWSRWGPRPLIALPIMGYVLLAVAGLLAPGVLTLYISLYSFTFVYIGLVGRPGVPLRMVPIAVLSYIIGSSHAVRSGLTALAIAAPMWCLIGELLARALSQRTNHLERIAETDPLTALGNRRCYERALTSMQPGDAVVVVDLDRFKRVNDVHGHQVGDDTLQQFADAMRSVTRDSDCVARYGGEEFAMVLARGGVSGSQDVLRRLCDEWNEAVTTFSAGIAVHREGESSKATLQRADSALYEAKANGRDCIEVAENDRRVAES